MKRIYLAFVVALWSRVIPAIAAPFMPDESAPRTVSELEKTHQIQTGPTPIEQWWWDIKYQLRQMWRNFADWLNDWLSSSGGPVKSSSVSPIWIKVLFWGALAIVLIIVGILLWRVWKNQPQQQIEGEFGDEELLQLPAEELQSRALNFAENGNYPEALRHLYISALVLLDMREIWRYDINLTNWEHISQLLRSQRRNQLIEPLSDMTRRFDRVRYGGAPCGSDDWENFRDVYRKLEANLPS